MLWVTAQHRARNALGLFGALRVEGRPAMAKYAVISPGRGCIVVVAHPRPKLDRGPHGLSSAVSGGATCLLRLGARRWAWPTAMTIPQDAEGEDRSACHGKRGQGIGQDEKHDHACECNHLHRPHRAFDPGFDSGTDPIKHVWWWRRQRPWRQ